jgi:hypothetical protein
MKYIKHYLNGIPSADEENIQWVTPVQGKNIRSGWIADARGKRWRWNKVDDCWCPPPEYGDWGPYLEYRRKEKEEEEALAKTTAGEKRRTRYSLMREELRARKKLPAGHGGLKVPFGEMTGLKAKKRQIYNRENEDE